MNRAWFLGLLVLLPLIGGLATLRGVELALVIPVILFWVYALWHSPDELKLEVRRELTAERVNPHAAIKVKIKITNVGSDLEELVLEDGVPRGLEILDGSNCHLISLQRDESFEFTYEVRGERGRYSFEGLRADAGDALGLLRRSIHVTAASRLVVLPSVSRIKAVPIRPRRTRVYAGAIPARIGGAGVEFFGLRPYEPGDSARRINWRAIARHPEIIYSNEFQQERVADVALVLDGRERTDLQVAGQSIFEASVHAAGSLASALLQQGNRVGLLVYSQYLQWTFPGYGRIQRERILQALAAAAPGGSQIFEGLQYLPTRLFPPESQIVLVSPLLEDDVSPLVQLRARGYQVLVICPDPVAFEMSALVPRRSKYSPAEARLAGRIVNLERALILGQLRRAGVQVIAWNVAEPFDRVMRGSARRLVAVRMSK